MVIKRLAPCYRNLNEEELVYVLLKFGLLAHKNRTLQSNLPKPKGSCNGFEQMSDE
jgi:hypothetical protein